MSKVHCDVCNVDLNRGGFAHHKKTKKHLIGEAKKYGKFDFASGQIIQNGGTTEIKQVEAKPAEIKQPKIEEITLSVLDEPFKSKNSIKIDPSLSTHDRNLVIKQRIIDMFEGQRMPLPFKSIINGINKIEHIDEIV